jgi:ParB-like chromosome segregation protein Spo0J
LTEKLRELLPVTNIPTEWINLNDWNPNFVPQDIKNAIKDDIRQNGFLGSIVLQKHNERMNKDNVIINGEHRFLAYKEMGAQEIPVVITDVDDTTAQILTIRLNREHGELLPNKVGDILNQITTKKKLDLSSLERLTYIQQRDLEALINLRKNDMADIIVKEKQKQKKMVTCPDCGRQIEIP